MLHVKIIAVGSLKESYLREACGEYEKRLGGLCRLSLVEKKESRLCDDPSEGEIARALTAEGEEILAEMPPRAYKIALCVEGREMSSEDFAALLEKTAAATGEVCLVIGSSYGLSEKVKAACDLRLSVSRMTLPHQLLRVWLLEIVYRALSITKGTKYHK